MKGLMERLETHRERGATMIEYALLVSQIAVVSVSTVTMVGHRTGDTFNNMAVALGSDASDSDSDVSTPDDPGADDPGDDYDPDDPDDGGGDDDEQDDPGSGPGEDDAAQGATVEILDTSAELTSWKGNRGTWTASVPFANAWDHDQELTVEVTQIDSNEGRQVATTVTIEVTAGGSSVLKVVDNNLSRNGRTYNDIAAVEIRVIAVQTNDANGQPVTYPLDDGPTTTVSHPIP